MLTENYRAIYKYMYMIQLQMQDLISTYIYIYGHYHFEFPRGSIHYSVERVDQKGFELYLNWQTTSTLSGMVKIKLNIIYIETKKQSSLRRM